ncbi:MAG: hypothetical protein ABMA13_23400 [Chthoniobacteraceae bacterium]
MSPEDIARIQRLAADNGILPLGGAEEIAAALNSQRPKVRLPGDNRELLHFAQDVGDELAKHDFYRRDRSPVGINREKARLDAITPQALRSMAQEHLVFFKAKEIGTGKDSTTIEIVKTMNVDTSRGVLESWSFVDKLPEIERVNPIRLPIMRRDSRIDLAPPGYFSESRIFTLDDGVVYDETMTFERAKEVLDALLCEFPWHDDGRSRRVQLSAMMTVFGACLLPKGACRPGFIYTANDSDAGKTLASKVAIIPVHGKVNARGFPRKEEMRKVLDQLAMDAATTILFDNVKGTLGGEDIEAFMSSSRWSGRVLGEKGGFEVDNVTTCFFSGNEAKPTRDMMQRCLFVELFLADIDSTKRKIKRRLTDSVLAETGLRSEVCSALWALVKYWDAQGRPAAPSMMPKCPEWSAIIGAIVACAGYGDPCERPDIKSTRGGAHEMQELVRKLAPGEGEVKSEWKFAEIMDEVTKEGLFENLELHGKKGDSEDLFDSEGALTPAAKSFFGRFLVSFDGRLFAGVSGERLRWVVQGKGNQRKYVVVAEDRAPSAPEPTLGV